MRNFKKEEKQLKQLLGDDFDSILITLIQISKVKDEYHNVGDVVSMNEHFLNHMFELLEKYDGYIDGWEIPFENYEISISGWFGDDSDRIPSKWN